MAVKGGGNAFARTICSICYEDLKPSVEDLQAISICGHVFHELCLQQWFEYCSSAKKCSCPVCKQSCSSKNAGRLYFQSVGDQTECQKAFDCSEEEEEEDPELLRGEVKRLETKASGLASILERQADEIKRLNQELCLSKNQLQKETDLRSDAIVQKASIQQLLRSKSEELDALKLEHLRLQDRNMALAKELAAIKLVSDLNLEEDGVLKLASFGNEANNKDTIDVLRKSLVIRNKSYKELMVKCNQLGRGEARSCEKLEKAKEKISKLKTRVQDLERIVEAKDNEVLRTLKASKKVKSNEAVSNLVSGDNNAVSTNGFSSECQKEQGFISVNNLDGIGSLTADQGKQNVINNTGFNSGREFRSAMAFDTERNAYFLLDEAASELSRDVHVISDPDSKNSTTKALKSTLSKTEAISDSDKQAEVHGTFCIRTGADSDGSNILAAAMDGESILSSDANRKAHPMLNIRKESPSPALTKPGDICFSSGLLGPDGTNRYLGKWCKRGQIKGSLAMQGTGAGSGDLIAVGSDGRGGRIKVLRSLNQSLVVGKENSLSSKRCKYGAKESSLQSQGRLQIEHFFGRASN